MELSSITDRLVHNLQRAQIEQIMTVTKALGLKVGSQFLANVEKVSQATPDQRTQLINTIEAQLAQLNRNSAAPAIKALIAELEAQKSIAQAPGLRLVNLSIPGSGTAPTATSISTATKLLTYTNQPIGIDQTLLMQLSEGQKLQLLKPMSKTEAAAFLALLSAQNSTSSPSAPPQVNISKATEVISDTMRRLLPQKDQGQDVLSALPKITQFIQQLPLAERKEWLSSQLQQSLKTLANHIRLSDQLSNPKLVEMTLRNNGQSFEHKLAEIVINQKPANTAAAAPAPLKPSNLSPSIPLSATQLSPPAHKTLITNQNLVEKIAIQDLKGSLLGLAHQLDNELELLKPAAVAGLATNDASKQLLAIPLPQFLGMLGNKQQGELNQKQLRTQLIMLMHQSTLGSIAKIQLQQAHTLNHQLGQLDQAQPSQSWQFEIPVRQGQEVHPLQIQLEQQWIEDQNETNEPNAIRVRQWNVMFSFDLAIVGKFYAQLTLIGENLSTKFWAENENTLIEAKHKIDGLKAQLEREGIQVTQMQFIPGAPPQPKISFSYSLVDIKT